MSRPYPRREVFQESIMDSAMIAAISAIGGSIVEIREETVNSVDPLKNSSEICRSELEFVQWQF